MHDCTYNVGRNSQSKCLRKSVKANKGKKGKYDVTGTKEDKSSLKKNSNNSSTDKDDDATGNPFQSLNILLRIGRAGPVKRRRRRRRPRRLGPLLKEGSSGPFSFSRSCS